MQVAGVALVPLLIGFVAVLKKTGLRSRWAGVVAFALGIAFVELVAYLKVITP